MINKLVLVFVSILLVIATYHFCFSIAEKFFFDKFFYKKSSSYGYYNPGHFTQDFNARSKYFNLINTPNTTLLANSTNANTYKIAVLGDSYVYGLGIKNSQRFVNLLKSKLNHIKTTEIIDISQTSTSPLNYYHWYKSLVGKYQPDLVIIVLVNNDAYIRPSSQNVPEDYDQIVKNCQIAYPKISPTLDISQQFYLEHINNNPQDLNNDRAKSFEESWNNPINLCVLNASLALLPTKNTIYFITDNYLEKDEKWNIYQNLLSNNSKTIISSNRAKNFVNYHDIWNSDPFSKLKVSLKEEHPNVLANQMYADVLYNEILNNPKWGFVIEK